MFKQILFIGGLCVILFAIALCVPPAPVPVVPTKSSWERVECYLGETIVFLQLGKVKSAEKSGALFIVTNSDDTEVKILADRCKIVK